MVVDDDPVAPPPTGSVLTDSAALVAVAVAAVFVLGGLLFVRLSQGSPGAGTWDGVERTSADVGSVEASSAGAVTATAAPGVVLITAEPGDSLWTIARRVAPGTDPRPVVAALIEANGGESVQIGQQIVIPGQLLD